MHEIACAAAAGAEAPGVSGAQRLRSPHTDRPHGAAGWADARGDSYFYGNDCSVGPALLDLLGSAPQRDVMIRPRFQKITAAPNLEIG